MQLSFNVGVILYAVSASAAVNPYVPQQKNAHPVQRGVARRDGYSTGIARSSPAVPDCTADTFSSMLPAGATVNLTQVSHHLQSSYVA